MSTGDQQRVAASFTDSPSIQSSTITHGMLRHSQVHSCIQANTLLACDGGVTGDTLALHSSLSCYPRLAAASALFMTADDHKSCEHKQKYWHVVKRARLQYILTLAYPVHARQGISCSCIPPLMQCAPYSHTPPGHCMHAAPHSFIILPLSTLHC